jgi:hypothetical protein
MRSGLRRRERGANSPIVDDAPKPALSVVRDPEAERAGLDAFAAGFRRAADQPTPVAPLPRRHAVTESVAHDRSDTGHVPRHGLIRRRPGEHLAVDALDHRQSAPSLAAMVSGRDANAERDALRDYVAGLARSTGTTNFRS